MIKYLRGSSRKISSFCLVINNMLKSAHINFVSLNPQDIKATFDLGHDNSSNQVGAEKLFAGAQLYIVDDG